MLVKNKLTGHEWLVSKEHGERLLKNTEEFELVEEKPKARTTKAK
ncbi:hypothetical protein [Bacillus sp. JJ722]